MDQTLRQDSLEEHSQQSSSEFSSVGYSFSVETRRGGAACPPQQPCMRYTQFIMHSVGLQLPVIVSWIRH